MLLYIRQEVDGLDGPVIFYKVTNKNEGTSILESLRTNQVKLSTLIDNGQLVAPRDYRRILETYDYYQEETEVNYYLVESI